MTLPYIFFAVAVTAALGNGLVQAMVPVGILLAPFFFRITRAATLEHARAQYVEAAELMGASKLHVVRAHVLRKVLPTIAVTTASMTAAALLAVSFLTFLGIGVQPPAPTWGGVLSSDLAYLAQAPWAPFIPGALIAITVGALNALADAFRDRRTPGMLAAVPDPVIRTHSTLEPADDDRQSQSSTSTPPAPASEPPASRQRPGAQPGRSLTCCASMTCTSACTTGRPLAVRGISLSIRAGRDRRPGRGVGQRQDADLPGRARRAARRASPSSRARCRSPGTT